MARVEVFCFFASYGLALGLELLHLWRPRPALRWLAVAAGTAGLVAQTIFLYARQPPLIWQFSWMVFLSWVLAVFYLCGAVHYRRFSWGLFVLPVVLGLVALGVLLGQPPDDQKGLWADELQPMHRLWGQVHAGLLFFAFVGVCVGFIASLMYLYQSHRLRTKALPGQGIRLLNLERLESMNRRAIVLTFPLLTAGVLAGAVLILRGSEVRWTDARVVGTLFLWLVFALLLYLRFGHHLRGRQVALMTVAAFVMLVCCLVLSHP